MTDLVAHPLRTQSDVQDALVRIANRFLPIRVFLKGHDDLAAEIVNIGYGHLKGGKKPKDPTHQPLMIDNGHQIGLILAFRFGNESHFSRTKAQDWWAIEFVRSANGSIETTGLYSSPSSLALAIKLELMRAAGIENVETFGGKFHGWEKMFYCDSTGVNRPLSTIWNYGSRMLRMYLDLESPYWPTPSGLDHPLPESEGFPAPWCVPNGDLDPKQAQKATAQEQHTENDGVEQNVADDTTRIENNVDIDVQVEDQLTVQAPVDDLSIVAEVDTSSRKRPASDVVFHDPELNEIMRRAKRPRTTSVFNQVEND